VTTADPAVGTTATRPAPSVLRTNLNLTRELSITAFKLKYTGSALGYVWSLLNPLLLFSMMYVVFDKLLGAGAGTTRFPMQLLVGIVLWTFFVDAVGGAMGSIVGASELIRKAYFPRIILVFASTITAFMTFLINIALLVVVGAISLAIGHPLLDLRWASLAIVLVVAEMYLFILGVGLLLASLNVAYRDMGHLWTIGSQALFFGSAVMYPITLKPKYAKLLALNPIAQMVNDARHLLVIGSVPSTYTLVGGLPRLLVPVLIAPALAVIGYVVFKRRAPMFAETM